MPITLDTFKAVANSTVCSSRDVVVQGEGKAATAKLGNFIFSQGKAANNATMAALKEALENEYGSLGTHAFDTVLGSRDQLRKSLRACDVKAVLSRIPQLRENRFVGELNRQLDVNPKMMQLSDEEAHLVRDAISKNLTNGLDLKTLQTPHDVARAAAKRIEQAIYGVLEDVQRIGTTDIGKAHAEQAAAESREPTGLRNLENVFKKGYTSVEDQIKRGVIGVGMRVNRSETNPVLLEKLKTNGVEPGFIFRNDWSRDDTRGFMAQLDTPENRNILESLKGRNPELANVCEGKTLREQIMLAGRAHPAGMAAVAEFAIMEAAGLVKSGHTDIDHSFAPLANAAREGAEELLHAPAGHRRPRLRQGRQETADRSQARVVRADPRRRDGR